MTLWRVRPMPVSTTQGHVISPNDGLPLCGLDDSPEPWVISTQKPAWPCDACLLVLAGTATQDSLARDVVRAEAEIELADAEYHHDTEKIALHTQWLADHPPIIVSSGGSS
jgi:hypothetical protein